MSASAIITMSIHQLNDVLLNHELFEPNEVKMAARMKVKKNRESEIIIKKHLAFLKKRSDIMDSMATCFWAGKS